MTVVSAIEKNYNSKTSAFDIWAQKMSDEYENVFALKA
jgi:hypothetical protein